MIYLAAPYWSPDPGTRDMRRRQVIEYGDRLFNRERALFYSPLLYSERYKDATTQEGYWLRHGEHMVGNCTEIRVLCLPGWEESGGIKREIAAAEKHGIPVVMIEKYARISYHGSRGITKSQIRDIFMDVMKRHRVETVVTHGEAGGACEAVRSLAMDEGLHLELHHLQKWRCAGAFHWRSTAVLENSEKAIFFHDGKSKGTANELKLARKMGVAYEYYLLKDGVFVLQEEEKQDARDFSILEDVEEDNYEKKIKKTERNSPTYKRFRKACLERDGFKCVMCGAEKELCVHHMVPFSKSDDLAVDPSNGQTLCKGCHMMVHGDARLF